MAYQFLRLLCATTLFTSITAQYPPLPSTANLTTITSPIDSSITISYKTPPKGTCATAFDTQTQYTGWINVPGDYPTNIFFWFIEGRTPTDQLTIWLNGGPGSSSLIGLFQGNGPCEAYEVEKNKFATRVRDFGWDRGSNMLYIDQPTQVGLSYDTPTNGSQDLLTSQLYTPPQSVPNSQPAYTFLNGTFSSLNQSRTANTTQTAALAVWHMLQGFLAAFPQYVPNATTPTVGVNLFVESYGGKYGPAFATLWQRQNAARLNGTISKAKTLPIKLVSLGIINGCVDDLIQGPYYPLMANSNTYGLSSINPTRASLANASFYAPGGCQELITKCRAAVAQYDITNIGNNASVNTLCSSAYSSCTTNVVNPYNDAGRSVYDIAHTLPESFPSNTYLEYLNLASTQAAIGTQLNFTQTNYQVVSAFTSTGDYERVSLVPALASLVSSGIRVGLIYGDRDYICNWLGGEAIAQAVSRAISPAYFARFPSSGYAPIIVNSSYIGGVVRQYGNLSFSRIYDAGHAVPAYQPETSFQVFARIISGTSVSTGESIDLALYNTSGPANATYTTSLPKAPAATCYMRAILDTCTSEQRNRIISGQAVIVNGVVYDKESDWPLYASVKSESAVSAMSTGSIEVSTTVRTTTLVMTGFYTATATPSSRNEAGIGRGELRSGWGLVVAGLAWMIMLVTVI